MKKLTLWIVGLLCFLALPISLPARNIPAIVSVEWLSRNLEDPNLIIVDIRSESLFQRDHIPGAVHAPFNSWIVKDTNLLLELPSDKALRDLLGSIGISGTSIVVIVNKMDTSWDRSDASRVAWTCIVAGIENVTVLDGGHNRWAHLNHPVTAENTLPIHKSYDGVICRSTVTSKAEVLQQIGTSILIDARLPEDYFGVTANKGHIPTALSLPAPWAYTSDGLFQDLTMLQKMVSGLIGDKPEKEIVLYCEVGGFASTWWFILSEVLGYQNVKMYDGSFQEWSQDPDAPITKFHWD